MSGIRAQSLTHHIFEISSNIFVWSLVEFGFHPSSNSSAWISLSIWERAEYIVSQSKCERLLNSEKSSLIAHNTLVVADFQDVSFPTSCLLFSFLPFFCTSKVILFVCPNFPGIFLPQECIPMIAIFPFGENPEIKEGKLLLNLVIRLSFNQKIPQIFLGSDLTDLEIFSNLTSYKFLVSSYLRKKLAILLHLKAKNLFSVLLIPISSYFHDKVMESFDNDRSLDT
jgi:hypothetical protein